MYQSPYCSKRQEGDGTVPTPVKKGITMSQDNTKKVAVIAANGRVGSLVIAEAVRRGFDVNAIARSDNHYRRSTSFRGVR